MTFKDFLEEKLEGKFRVIIGENEELQEDIRLEMLEEISTDLLLGYAADYYREQGFAARRDRSCFFLRKDDELKGWVTVTNNSHDRRLPTVLITTTIN